MWQRRLPGDLPDRSGTYAIQGQLLDGSGTEVMVEIPERVFERALLAELQRKRS
jgi:hypothetical protein